MSTNFFFKSVEIENFRVFKHIRFTGMRRINLISGINGSGKSALIETIFLSIDLANPACLVRPYQWRGIPLSGDDLKLLFPNVEVPAKVETITHAGTTKISLEYGTPNKEFVLSATKDLTPSAKTALSQLSASNTKGVHVTASTGHPPKDSSKWFYSQSGDSINAAGYSSEATNPVLGTYLSQFAPSAPHEIADRVSKLIKIGKKRKVIEYLQVLSPPIKDIAVFQDGLVAQTYVELAGEKFVPLALMGGGVRALTEMVTCAMISEGGVLFIDELDSALHFSVVPKIWNVLATIANAENVQVFAISHSRETISSAASGVKDAGRSADFQYIRVDNVDETHRCVAYTMEELQDAMDLHVEVR